MALSKITGSNISNTTQAILDALRFNAQTSGLSLPSGTTSQRPTGISLGTIRFNTTKDGAEVYNTQTGVPDWNGIGSETGVDGGDAFIKTNGTTITKTITIGPTANGDQKYTHGLLIGDITIDSGYEVTVEEGSIVAIVDEEINPYQPDTTSTSTDVMSATGGNEVSTLGLYKVHTFFQNGTFTPTIDGTVEVLIVAGGGGGALWYGGGGGGGGVLYASSYTVTANTPYNVVVGSGGLGQTTAPGTGGTQASYGLRGGDSSFGPLIARGGGGGPGYNASPSNSGEYQFTDGGSGGGGRVQGNGEPGRPFRTYTPATASLVQSFGHRGGPQGGNYGGGGGGAGTSGNSGNIDGKGGDGIFFNFDGTNRYYAAGGGGGTSSGTSQGGLGGGGAGSTTNGGDATGYGCGGGSGGTGAYVGVRGGNGTAGIVMVRYIYRETTVQTFTNTGTTTWTVPANVDYATVLVVGGGGGGAGSGGSGSGPRGGGGAGGYISYPNYILSTGQSITITVGTAGSGGAGGGENVGGSGSQSAFGNLVAIGGGAGGTYNGAGLSGSSGGSGGGIAYVAGSTTNAGTQFQGYRGGTGQFFGESGASGGGGAGGAGYDTRQSAEPSGNDKGGDTGGDGGEGRINAISGTPLYYAGGGGAGAYPTGDTRWGLGGSGVGGRGASGGNTATAGAINTGSGGGAGGSSAGGAAGGTGIVIVRYGYTGIQVSGLGLSASTPATSAAEILLTNPTATSGVYWIKPTSYSGSAFEVYCDMTTGGGGWMHVGTISDNNESRGETYNTIQQSGGNHPWAAPLMPAQDCGIWQNSTTLGTQSFTSNFKSQAWISCPFTQFLMKDQGNTLRNLFYTNTGQITANNSSFSSFWGSLLWNADGSDNSNVAYQNGRVRGVGITNYGVTDPVLESSNKSVILLKFGERDGVQDGNKDRSMIATHRSDQGVGVDGPSGIGCFTYHDSSQGGPVQRCRNMVPVSSGYPDEPPNSISGTPYNYTLWVR